MKSAGIFSASIISIIMLASCSDQSLNGIDINAAQQKIVNTWQVTYYLQDNENQTHFLQNYTFVFNSDGTMTVQDATDTYNGTWTVAITGESQAYNEAITMDIPDFDSGILDADWFITDLEGNSMRLLSSAKSSDRIYFAPL